MPDPEKHHIHLISDSTAETLNAMARAALALFSTEDVKVHVAVFARSERDLQQAVDAVERHPGLVLYTVMNPGHRAALERRLEQLGVPSLPALDSVIAGLSRFLGRAPEVRAGLQHRLGPDYFRRIEALDYAIANDDGAIGQRLLKADVILTGVSRTSKTPTCIYLAYRGVKAANVPLLPRRAPDAALFDAIRQGVPAIGLTASPTRLKQIRTERLDTLGSDRSDPYADLDAVREEVAEARLLFQRLGIPVIDVTRRSIEETAAEVQAMLRQREPQS